MRHFLVCLVLVGTLMLAASLGTAAGASRPECGSIPLTAAQIRASVHHKFVVKPNGPGCFILYRKFFIIVAPTVLSRSQFIAERKAIPAQDSEGGVPVFNTVTVLHGLAGPAYSVTRKEPPYHDPNVSTAGGVSREVSGWRHGREVTATTNGKWGKPLPSMAVLRALVAAALRHL